MGVSHLCLCPSSVCLSRRLWLKTVWVLIMQRFIAKSLLVFSVILGIFLWHYPNWVSAHLFWLFSIWDVNNLSCFEVCKFVGPSSTLPRRALEQLLFSLSSPSLLMLTHLILKLVCLLYVNGCLIGEYICAPPACPRMPLLTDMEALGPLELWTSIVDSGNWSKFLSRSSQCS